MKPLFTLSRATASDRSQLIQFWTKLDDSLPPTAFGSSPSGKKKLYQKLARQLTSMDHGFALMAWREKQPVACVCGHIYDKDESINTPVGILYNLWVEPDARRQQLATQLVDEAEVRLRSLGAKSFQVAWRNDPTAESFWRRRGYQGYETMAGKHS
ncbi:GNAT family N-acetyltransferase [Halioxenophilus sp. WMMB6]|uniref:GNAT family N-acetyltransferase n=1 Tax=Halioxenophilus sp. WMMB6 TaxID=3073815 RepID=UPI00295E535F|nr:GNAT family N-acetyltransferase [Halioxenophilus sp. WMMB6]